MVGLRWSGIDSTNKSAVNVRPNENDFEIFSVQKNRPSFSPNGNDNE